MPPFTAIGLGTPSLGNYGGGIPSLGAFALASTAGALGNANPAALRGLSNVLLVSNLNEEVIFYIIFIVNRFALNRESFIRTESEKSVNV